MKVPIVVCSVFSTRSLSFTSWAQAGVDAREAAALVLIHLYIARRARLAGAGSCVLLHSPILPSHSLTGDPLSGGRASCRSSNTNHTSLPDPLLLSLLLSRFSRPRTRLAENPDLQHRFRYSSWQVWLFSFGMRFFGCNQQRDPPQPAAEGAAGRRSRRRHTPPAARVLRVPSVRVRSAWGACMGPGDPRAGGPRSAQFHRILGAGLCRICTAGRAVLLCTHMLCVDCECG